MSLMSLIAFVLVLIGVVLALKGIYLLAGDVEPDGTVRESIRDRKRRLRE